MQTPAKAWSKTRRAEILWASSQDGSRCGQPFNGSLYAGFSNPLYGTITAGRQNSLVNDAVGVYDPLAGSYAFSLIGFSGGAFGGIGSTETARWDNSIKYVFTYGPFHAAGMYAFGEGGSEIQNNAYAANVGVTYMGFSLDAIYTKENSAVNMATIGNGTGGQLGNGSCNSTVGGTVLCPFGDWLNATITDNEAFTVAGKYVYEFGGGFKDEKPWGKLTWFGGYNHSALSDPSQWVFPGSTTIGDYKMWTVNNLPYYPGSDRVLQTYWAGVRFDTGPWAFTAAWYEIDQNTYISHSLNATTFNACTFSATTTPSRAWASNCSGSSSTVSGVVDYTFDKHFDVYSGVSWSDVSGGLANGFVGSLENVTWMSGLRVKF